jgi:hypothetical protein
MLGPLQTTVVVSVLAEPGEAPGAINWSQSFHFIPQGNGKNTNGKIHITAPGEAQIILDLDDRSGMHLRFRDDPLIPDYAIWIALGIYCPTVPGNGNGQFALDWVQNKQLRVTDFHTDQNEYGYVLRFDSDTDVKVFDPIIKN